MTHRSYSVGTAAINELMSYNTMVQNISREKLIPESFYDNLGWRTFFSLSPHLGQKRGKRMFIPLLNFCYQPFRVASFQVPRTEKTF